MRRGTALSQKPVSRLMITGTGISICAVKPLKFPERVAFCHDLSNEQCRLQDEAELCPIDGEKNQWQVEDRARYYREKVSVRSSDEVTSIAQFFRGFDAWLVDVRNDEYHI
jgi:hypothetical protein